MRFIDFGRFNKVWFLQELEQRLELAMTSSTPTAPVTTPLSTTVPPATTMTVTTPTSPSPFMEGVVSLREVNLYQNCSTSVEATCLIPPADGTGRCTTTPLVPLNRPGVSVGYPPPPPPPPNMKPFQLLVCSIRVQMSLCIVGVAPCSFCRVL